MDRPSGVSRRLEPGTGSSRRSARHSLRPFGSGSLGKLRRAERRMPLCRFRRDLAREGPTTAGVDGHRGPLDMR